MGGKILLVEDEVTLRREIAEFLRSEDYLVEEAAGGAKALGLIATSNFDVIISDLRLMSRISGADLLAYADRISPQTIKVLISGVGNLQCCDSIGAVFVTKPVQLAELLFKIQILLAYQIDVSRLTPETRLIITESRSQRVTSGIMKLQSREIRMRSKEILNHNDELRKRAFRLYDQWRKTIATQLTALWRPCPRPGRLIKDARPR